MFSNLNSIIRRRQVFHAWRPCLNTKRHMYFPFFPFSQQNPWPCIPVSMDFFHPNRNTIIIVGRGIWHFYISTSRTFTIMFNWREYIIVPLMNVTWYSCTSDTVQYFLLICDCNAMDEAAAAFSSDSGDRTLEYNMICQCKRPSCCSSITPLKTAIQWYACQSYWK